MSKNTKQHVHIVVEYDHLGKSRVDRVYGDHEAALERCSRLWVDNSGLNGRKTYHILKKSVQGVMAAKIGKKQSKQVYYNEIEIARNKGINFTSGEEK